MFNMIKQRANFCSLINNMTLFSNKDYLILNKSSNLSCQGGLDLENNLYHLLDKKYYIVHRLDRNTTGLLFFAKHKKSARDFALLLQNQTIEKQYLAVCQGLPVKQFSFDSKNKQTDPYSGTILMKQKYDQQNKKTISSYFCDQSYLSAITHYEILGFILMKEQQLTGYLPQDLTPNLIFQNKFRAKQSEKWMTIYKLSIKGGRKHQIRSHMENALRTPVIFDNKYGYSQDFDLIHNLNKNNEKVEFLSKNQMRFQEKTMDISQDNYDYDLDQLKQKKIMGLHAWKYTIPGEVLKEKGEIYLEARIPFWIEKILQQAYNSEQILKIIS